MAEHPWHKKVRNSIFAQYDPKHAFTSHSSWSKLFLFHIPAGGRPGVRNCMSDADIVALSPDSSEVVRIIEVESAMNPKKIMGIVMATHFSNIYSLRRAVNQPKEYAPLKDIILEIVYKKAPEKSHKDEKADIFMKYLNDFVRNTDGCLNKEKEIILRPHD